MRYSREWGFLGFQIPPELKRRPLNIATHPHHGIIQFNFTVSTFTVQLQDPSPVFAVNLVTWDKASSRKSMFSKGKHL